MLASVTHHNHDAACDDDNHGRDDINFLLTDDDIEHVNDFLDNYVANDEHDYSPQFNDDDD